MNFFSQLIQAFKKCGGALVGVSILATFFDQSLTIQIESQLRSPDGATAWIMAWAGFYLATSIFFTTLSTLIAIYGTLQSRLSLSEFLFFHLNSTCIEVVRGWGRILAWSLLFILPGFYKYLQYIFIPFVVTQDQAYQNGEVDALVQSRLRFKRVWGRLILLFISFHMVWSYISVSLFDAYRMIWQTPLQAVLISLLEAVVFLVYIGLIQKIYQKSLAGPAGAGSNKEAE